MLEKTVRRFERHREKVSPHSEQRHCIYMMPAVQIDQTLAGHYIIPQADR